MGHYEVTMRGHYGSLLVTTVWECDQPSVLFPETLDKNNKSHVLAYLLAVGTFRVNNSGRQHGALEDIGSWIGTCGSVKGPVQVSAGFQKKAPRDAH